MGVAEEVDRWLAVGGAELLDLTDRLAAESRLARSPHLRLVRMMELGKDEIDPIIGTGVGEDQIEPVELLRHRETAVGVEGDHADVLVIGVVPVFLEPRSAGFGELEVVEVELSVRLVVSQCRHHRDVTVQVLRLAEEMVLPVGMVGTGRHQIPGNQRECDALIEWQPVLEGEEVDHSLVDDLLVLDAVAAELAIGIGDEPEGGFRGERRRGAQEEGCAADRAARHPVVVAGSGKEPGQLDVMDESATAGGDGGAAGARAESGGGAVLDQALAVPLGLPADDHRGRRLVLQVGLDEETCRLGGEGCGGGDEDHRDQEDGGADGAHNASRSHLEHPICPVGR